MADDVQKANVSNGFGIAGFVISLCVIVLGIIFPFFYLLSILSLIFCIIQMKRYRTGLSIAGLVLSIIGILLFILMIVITMIWVMVIPDIQEDIKGGTSCFEADASLSISSSDSCLEDGIANIKVQRNQADFDLEDIKIIMGCEGSTSSKMVVGDLGATLPEKGESRTYTVDPEDLVLECIDLVSVAAILPEQECNAGMMIQLDEC